MSGMSFDGEPAVEQRTKSRSLSVIEIPRPIIGWIGLQILSFPIGWFIGPPRGRDLLAWGITLLITATVAFGLVRHSRVAWTVALVLGIWPLLGGLPLITHFGGGSTGEAVWLLWGLVFGSLSIALLLSRTMRLWVAGSAAETEGRPPATDQRGHIFRGSS